MTNDTVTIKQAADLLKVHPDTVRRWCASSRLPARKSFGMWIIDKDDVRRELIKKTHQELK